MLLRILNFLAIFLHAAVVFRLS